MSKIRIGCVTYGQLTSLMKSTIGLIKDPEIEISLYVGLMEDVIDSVQAAYADGVEIFVASGANAEVMKGLNVPMVTIYITFSDFLRAALKAKQYGKHVVFAKYYASAVETLDIKLLEELTGIELSVLTFVDKDSLQEQLNSHEADVIIGGGYANEVAQSRGLPGVLIYPGENAMESFVREAKHVATTARRERQRSQITEAVLQYAQNGFVATDMAGNITVYNNAAERVLRRKVGKVLDMPADQVLPELGLTEALASMKPEHGQVITVDGIDLLVSRMPLGVGNTATGMMASVQRVTDLQRAEQKIRLSNAEKGFVAKATFSDIIGKCKAMREAVSLAKLYASGESNVLLYGETGVGKELFAQSIHNHSSRQSEPFIAINCATLPENLLESELFGYAEGAFTGGKKGGKIGLFELAHKGTIFLDEISEMPLALQSRLLRVLQENQIMRIGGDRIIQVDVRVIAATNVPIKKELEKRFRADLYYRLSVFSLQIPPLRNRENDAIDLFMHFLKQNRRALDQGLLIAEAAARIFPHCRWRGNVRELQNVAERFMLLFRDMYRVEFETVKRVLTQAIGEETLYEDVLAGFGIDYFSDDIKKKITPEILETLEAIFGWSKTETAQKTGVSRTTLWRMSKE